MSATTLRKLVIPAVVLGVILVIVAIVYFVEPAHSLPSFFPGTCRPRAAKLATITPSTVSPRLSWRSPASPSPGFRADRRPAPHERRLLRSVERERQRAGEPEHDAIDAERAQAVGLKVAQQELHGQECRQRRAQSGHERLSANAVALRSEQFWHLECGGREDHRGREQEAVAGGVLVGEADQKATAQREARAGDAG